MMKRYYWKYDVLVGERIAGNAVGASEIIAAIAGLVLGLRKE